MCPYISNKQYKFPFRSRQEDGHLWMSTVSGMCQRSSSEEGDWRFGEWTEGQPQVHQPCPPKPVPLLPLQHRVIIMHLVQIAAIFFVNVNDAKINFIKDSISIDLVERLHPRSKFVQNLFFRVSPRLHCHPCCSAVGERGHNVSHMDV